MRNLERKYHLLGPENKKVFPSVEGTPPFSAFIADLSIQELNLQDGSEKNVWDPYCGNGVILRTFAVLHREITRHLFASDIRDDAVEQTELNLLMCSLEDYHQADDFKELLVQHGCIGRIPVTAFSLDVIHENAMEIPDDTVDVVITDPPYEYMESFFENPSYISESSVLSNYLHLLLESLRRKMRDGAKVGLILDSSDNYEDALASNDGYEFNFRKLLHSAYKNRVLYSLSTTP